MIDAGQLPAYRLNREFRFKFAAAIADRAGLVIDAQTQLWADAARDR